MTHEATIGWRGDKNAARALLDAIIPDDPGSFDATMEVTDSEACLTIVVRADTVGSLKSTVDDLLACLAAAEAALVEP